MLDHTMSDAPPIHMSISEQHKKIYESAQWCMYFWTPQSIKMKKGKMSGQVAHASARLARMMSKEEWDDYTRHEVKIVYKVKDIDAMFKVRSNLITNHLPLATLYPVEYETIVFDNTWEVYTVFGIATKRDLKNIKWKLA